LSQNAKNPGREGGEGRKKGELDLEEEDEERRTCCYSKDGIYNSAEKVGGHRAEGRERDGG